MRETDLEQLRLDLLTYNHQCAMLQLLVPPISKVEHDHTYTHSSCHEQLSGSKNSLVVNTETEFKLTSAIKEHIITELTVTTIEHQDIEQRTRQQSNSILWHQVRARRITGSKCGRILCAKKYTESLLISLLYPRPMCYPPKPIEWGWNNEERAKKAYETHMTKNGHENLEVKNCGFIIHPTQGWLYRCLT